MVLAKRAKALFILDRLVELLLEGLIFSRETILLSLAGGEEVEVQVAVDFFCLLASTQVLQQVLEPSLVFLG